MEKKIKKLSLKKVTVLNFEEASRVVGGTGDCPYSTAAVNCISKPGRDDSCNNCLTNEPSCPSGCASFE